MNDSGPVDTTHRHQELTPEQREHAFRMQITMFSASTALVGVCVTTISLIVAIKNLSDYSTLCDALLAVDSLLFLFAAFCSFISFRLQFRWRWRALLLVAEIALLCGLSFMVVVCALLAWALT
jgi:hypothetical protein